MGRERVQMTFSILRAEQLSGKLVHRWAPEPGEMARADGRARAPRPGSRQETRVRARAPRFGTKLLRGDVL